MFKILKYVMLIVFTLSLFFYFPTWSPLKNKPVQKMLKSELPIKISENLEVVNLQLNSVENSEKMGLYFSTKGDIFIEGYSVGNVKLDGTDLYFYPETIKLNKYKIKSNGAISFIQNKIKEFDSVEVAKVAEKIKSKLNIKIWHTATNLSFVDMKVSVRNSNDVNRIYYQMRLKPWIFWSIFGLTLIIFLQEIGLLAIGFYQQYISPRKGYRCAKGVLHGGETCSASVKRVMKDEGFVSGIKEYFNTTKECKHAYEQIEKDRLKQKKVSGCSSANSAKATAAGVAEENVCGCGELGIDSCEGGSCDAASCDAGGCDIGSCDVGAC